MSVEVQGRCPACGWTGLFLGSGGLVTCSQYDCPDPCAASDLLAKDPRQSAEALVVSQQQRKEQTSEADKVGRAQEGTSVCRHP